MQVKRHILQLFFSKLHKIAKLVLLKLPKTQFSFIFPPAYGALAVHS